MDGVAEIGPIISEAEASKSPERRYSRAEVLQAFNDAFEMFDSYPIDKLTPQQQAARELLKSVKEKTLDKGKTSYLNTFKGEDGKTYKQKENIAVDELIIFLRERIKSGELSPEEETKYRDQERALFSNAREFYRGSKRKEYGQKMARIAQEAERIKSNPNLLKQAEAEAARVGAKPEDGPFLMANRLLFARRELILPKEMKDDEDEEEETVQQISRNIAITNKTIDIHKHAAYLAEQLLHAEMQRGSSFNPLNWGRKIGLRTMEEYWRQRLIQQIETSMRENNNSLLTMDIAKSAIRARDLFRGKIEDISLDVSANKAKEQAEGQDTNTQLRLSAQEKTLISGQRVEEAQGALRNMMISEIIRPLVEGKITEDKIQDKLREFVRTHQGDPQVLAIFGPDANKYGRIANYFATDLKEAASVIREDIAAHKYAIEQLGEVVRIQLANADWAASTEVKFTKADQAIAWAEKHRLSGLLANPAVIGAAFSIATFATLRATGMAAKASQWIVPGAGLLPAAAFAAFRRNYDLKVDRASHQAERAYNRQIPPDAPRREALERYAYNTASVTELLNGGGQELVGGGTRLSLENLLATDLTITSNQEALIRRTTEMKSRLDFSAEQKIDLVTFEDRTSVQHGKLQLIEAIAQAHTALRNANMKNNEIELEEARLGGEWRQQYIDNKEKQDKSFNHYKFKESIKAGIFGGAVGMAGSFFTQEIWAGIGKGFFHQQIGNTALENAFSGKSPTEWFGSTRAAGFAVDQAKELYEHPGNLQISDKLTLAIDANHSGSIIDTVTGNKIPTPPLHLTENGQFVFSGKMDDLPIKVRDVVGGWENRVNTNPAFNLEDHLKAAVSAPEGAGHETFQHGDWVIDVNSGPGHQMSMTHWPTQTQIHGFIKPGGVLDIDSTFGGNGSITPAEWQDMQTLLQANGWATSSETVSGRSLFGPEGEWKNYSTNVDHREWYSYDRPGSQHNELRLDDYKDGSKVILDMNRMQLGYQNGLNPNPINVQEVIQSREGGFYFSTPDTPQDGIWVPDGADGVWDGKLALDPNDLDPTHVIQTSKGPLQLGEFSRMVLNQDALQKYPNGNIATEVFDRQDVFNLGQGGKDGFIEAGRMLNKDGVNVLQDFATIRGITEAQPTIPKEIFAFEPPIATEFDPPPPTELEPPPLIPIPFAPRFPLEKMMIMGYGGSYSEGGLGWLGESEWERRRSKTLKENPNAKLDESKEVVDYFSRMDLEYRRELEGMDRTIGTPMSAETRAVITIPAFGEGKIIRKTLEQFLSQKGVNGDPINPNLFEIIVYENDTESRPKDETEEVIRRFKQAHPEINIHYAYKRWSKEDIDNNINTVGNGRRYCCDLALLRSSKRTLRPGELIIINQDADLEGITPKYIAGIVTEFDSKDYLDSIVGKRNLPDWALKKPNVRAGQRMWEIFDAVMRKGAGEGISPSERETGWPGMIGENSAMRASMYAAIGGYNPRATLAEDQELGHMMRIARNYDDRRFEYLNRLQTIKNPRRYLTYMYLGKPLIDMYNDYHENKDIRDLDNQQLLRRIPDNFDVARFQLDADGIYQKKGDFTHYKNNEFDLFFQKMIGFMGAEYAIENGHVKITNVDRLLERLNNVPTTTTPVTATQTRRQKQQQTTPKQTRTTPGSISELANRAITQATGNQVSVEATPREISQSIKSNLDSFIPTLGLTNPATNVGIKIKGNHVSLNGLIDSMEGKARFEVEFITDHSGKLTPLPSYIHISSRMENKLGDNLSHELRSRLSGLTASVPPKLITSQIDPMWEISGSHIVNGKLVLDFNKTAAPVQTPPTQATTPEQPPVDTAVIEPSSDESKRISKPMEQVPLNVAEARRITKEAYPGIESSPDEMDKDLKKWGWDTPENIAAYQEKFLKEYVEEPAQPLVRQLWAEGKHTVSSNVYGPGRKGVIWKDDQGELHFVPLAGETLPIEAATPTTPNANQVLEQLRQEGEQAVQQARERAQQFGQQAREQLRQDHEVRMRRIVEPERAPAQPANLIDRVNQRLAESTQSTTNYEALPQTVIDYLKTVKLARGAQIKEVHTQTTGDHISLDGNVTAKAGFIPVNIPFKIRLENDPNGGLRVADHSINLPGPVEFFRGEIEKSIIGLNQSLLDKVNERINPAWKAIDMRIENGNLKLNFRKK